MSNTQNKFIIPIAGVILLGLVIWGFKISSERIEEAQTKAASLKYGEDTEKNRMERDEATTKKSGFSGNVLAGTTTPYLEFNKVDYDKALAEGMVVFLDFYANWCPICRAEAPEIKAAFDSLNAESVVGFRVNYNDSDTDDTEKALAKEYGVTYQHTKVILKNGKQILKETEQWDKEQFVDAINNLVK